MSDQWDLYPRGRRSLTPFPPHAAPRGPDLDATHRVEHNPAHREWTIASLFTAVPQASIDPDDRCPICVEPFPDPTTEDPDPVVAIACGHVFCRKCVETWLRQSAYKNCPICRHRLMADPMRVPPADGSGSGATSSTSGDADGDGGEGNGGRAGEAGYDARTEQLIGQLEQLEEWLLRDQLILAQVLREQRNGADQGLDDIDEEVPRDTGITSLDENEGDEIMD